MLARLAAVVVLALAGVAGAAERVQTIKVDDAFARAMPPGARTAGAYLSIANRGDGPDRLLSARSERAGSVELHEMSEQGGMMRMRPVDAVVIPPGKTVQLTPAGLHLMLVDPKPPLKQGEHIPLTLHFERAGDVGVDVVVGAMGATHAH
jgi:periplasmic copper chaperone A